MLNRTAAKKVSVYVGADVQHHGEPLYLAILNYLFERGVAGATVTKGMAGFGSHHRLHTTRILEMSENLPVKLEFVEQTATLEDILPTLAEMASAGLIDIQDTSVITYAPEGSEPTRR